MLSPRGGVLALANIVTLIHNAQEEVNNAKQFLNLIKGIDVGSETAKKTISKGVSGKDD